MQRGRCRMQLRSASLKDAPFGYETRAKPKTLDGRDRPRQFAPAWPDGRRRGGLAVIAYETRELIEDETAALRDEPYDLTTALHLSGPRNGLW